MSVGANRFGGILPVQYAVTEMSLSLYTHTYSIYVYVCVCVCVWWWWWMQALTLEVELLVSFLIRFAVPAVPAPGEGRKRVAESTDCAEKIKALNYKNFNAATNAAHHKSVKKPSRPAGAVNPTA